MDKPWGTVAVGTRLEKQVDSLFVERWSHLISKGLRKGDAWMLACDRPAHQAANELIRRFLKSEQEALLFLDSDADFDVNFLSVLRDFEPGWKYDALQAFHTRRGWPPEAIWHKQQGERLVQCAVLEEGTEDVGMIGTHCALFRRAVFERIYEAYGGGVDMADFQWFCYPRHQKMSDEATLSKEALELGFHLGATTAVKVDHISRVSTGWETHQEWLRISGTRERLAEFHRLAQLVAEFTGQPLAEVEARALEGSANVREAWMRQRPEGAEQTRRFYGGDAYLYDLVRWNADGYYRRIIDPLRHVAGKRCLVIGAGLGSEAALLVKDNQVDVFELPGVLKEFCRFRFGDQVTMLDGERLADALRGGIVYDLVVAVDVLEHVHPSEIYAMLDEIWIALAVGGRMLVHNNFGEREKYPMHFDHSQRFEGWLRMHELEKESEYVYRSKTDL